MKQWNEFGMDTGSQKPVAQLMFLTDVHAMGPKIAKGLTTLTAWYWALNEETRAFGERFFKLRGTMPTAPQAAVYSGVSHYLKAVAQSAPMQRIRCWKRCVGLPSTTSTHGGRRCARTESLYTTSTLSR